MLSSFRNRGISEPGRGQNQSVFMNRNLSRLLSMSLLVLCFAFLMPPGAGANWVPIGPFGGDVRSMVADPENPARMYLGTRTGQIFSTDDAGQSWNRVLGFHAPADWAVDSLVIDPNNSAILYAAMWSISNKGGGVYRSTDRGTSWVALAGIEGQSVRALAAAPSAPGILVAGTLEGVFRTRDGGASWERISPSSHGE